MGDSATRGCDKTEVRSKSLDRQTSVVAVEYADINPMKPCGACTEWLKKIAEVNPAFRIATFTDANCNGIYVDSILAA